MIIYNKKKMQQGGITATGESKWYDNTNTTGYISSAADTINQAVQGNKRTYNPGTYQGNMLTSNVETVDPKMENQGEATSAATGAVSGAIEGYQSSGDLVGAGVGAVLGGLSSWMGTDAANSAAYSDAKIKEKEAKDQAESNYASYAQNRYRNQYSAYRQKGGELSAIPQPTMTGSNQLGTTFGINNNNVMQPVVNSATVPVDNTQPTTNAMPKQSGAEQVVTGNPTTTLNTIYRKGGSFDRKINILMSDVSKKA
jgi:hypothetical protein